MHLTVFKIYILVLLKFTNFFYYVGPGDTVRCFFCGCEMSNWTSTENIWKRHARQAPQCQLLIQEKGSDWVARVIEEHGRLWPKKNEPKISVCVWPFLSQVNVKANSGYCVFSQIICWQ